MWEPCSKKSLKKNNGKRHTDQWNKTKQTLEWQHDMGKIRPYISAIVISENKLSLPLKDRYFQTEF